MRNIYHNPDTSKWEIWLYGRLIVVCETLEEALELAQIACLAYE